MRISRISLLLAFGVAGSLAFAQMGMQQGMGQGMRQGRRARLYDTSTVTTVKGTVEEVEQGNRMGHMMNQGGMMNQQGTMMGQQGGMMNQQGRMSHMRRMGWMGTHLLLKTQSGPLNVMVGPSSYLAEKNFSFAKGDEISVTGSKVSFRGREELIAREIQKGGKTLTLRNQDGTPLWSRGMRRSGNNSGT
jgi:hypothetical protein